MDLQGRIALVTGASSGIGYATALRMAEVGADIVIGYEQKELAARTLSGGKSIRNTFATSLRRIHEPGYCLTRN